MKRTEAIVGAFVLVCVAILCAAVYLIGNTRFIGAHVPFHTYLRYAGGIEPGTAVLFGGITVGKVVGVAPDGSDPTRIKVDIDVKTGKEAAWELWRELCAEWGIATVIPHVKRSGLKRWRCKGNIKPATQH